MNPFAAAEDITIYAHGEDVGFVYDVFAPHVSAEGIVWESNESHELRVTARIEDLARQAEVLPVGRDAAIERHNTIVNVMNNQEILVNSKVSRLQVRRWPAAQTSGPRRGLTDPVGAYRAVEQSIIDVCVDVNGVIVTMPVHLDQMLCDKALMRTVRFSQRAKTDIQGGVLHRFLRSCVQIIDATKQPGEWFHMPQGARAGGPVRVEKEMCYELCDTAHLPLAGDGRHGCLPAAIASGCLELVGLSEKVCTRLDCTKIIAQLF